MDIKILSLLVLCLRLTSAGFCPTAYACSKVCYKSETYSTSCGFLWLWSCTKYRTISSTCYSQCYRQQCCAGFTGANCDIHIEPCMSEAAGCTQNCSNTLGTIQCSCYSGYSLQPDLKSCSDDNECLMDKTLCEQDCTNTEGSYVCNCTEGYVLDIDGRACLDVDECSSGMAQCSHSCRNIRGSYICECPLGYVLSEDGITCTDLNECESAGSGCQHYCNNTVGSYGCVCRSGFTLDADKRSCTDVDECQQNNGGCEHTCVTHPVINKCSCNNGYRLLQDGKSCEDINECREDINLCRGHCNNTEGAYSCECPSGHIWSNIRLKCENIDDCVGVTCHNNGSCVDGITKFTCECLRGFTGQYCETDINECEILNGGCEENCTNTLGSHRCSCKLNDLQTDERTCSEAAGDTVFERYNMTIQQLPVGCYNLTYSVRVEGKDVSLDLVSTSVWYTGTNTIYTNGTVSVSVSESYFPFSLQGAVVHLATGKIFPHPVTHIAPTQKSIASSETKSNNCISASFSVRDYMEFINRNAYMKTFMANLQSVLPLWIRFKELHGQKANVFDLRSQLLSGGQLSSLSYCNSAPVFKDRLYLIYTFRNGINMYMSDDVISFPPLLGHGKYCLTVDVETRSSSVFLTFPEEAQKSLLALQFFRNLYERFKIIIKPRGIGVSLENGISMENAPKEIEVWNGDNMFNYNVFDEADVWISGDVEVMVPHSLIEVKGQADIFLAVPNTHSILTSTFIEKWELLFTFNSFAGYTIDYGDFQLILAPVSLTIEAYMSVGEYDNRTWCGLDADPPGIFLSMIVTVNPFQSIPALAEAITLDFTYSLHAYFFLEEQTKLSLSQEIILQNSIENITFIVSGLLSDVSNVLSSQAEGDLYNTMTHIYSDLNKLSTSLNHIQSRLATRNYKIIFPLVQQVWEYINGVREETARILKQPAEENELKQTLISIKNASFTLVEDGFTFMNRWSRNIISSFPRSTGFGMVFHAYLTIIDMDFLVRLELSFSESGLFRCSRFHEISKFLENERAFKFMGTIQVPISLGKFVEVSAGFGFGGAVSVSSGRFLYRFHAYVSFLGLSVTSDVFISESGINTYIQGNIFDIFYAEIDVLRELGRSWYDIAYTLRGRLAANVRKRRQIQHDSSSFEASYSQALLKAIDVIANEADERLQDVEDALSLAENGIMAARDWLTDKLDRLSNVRSKHENNLSLLEKAKKALVEAKKPFEIALSRLNSAQRAVDNLCKIKSCTSFCIPGLKCKICWKKVWFIIFPYPCCSYTHCMVRIPDPLCILHNIVCFAARAVAFAALDLAKTMIRIPLIALDQARSFLTVVQIAVGETELLVGLAEVASINAKIAFDIAQDKVRTTRRAVEMGRQLVKIATPLIKAIAENVGNLIDVRKCGFNLVIRTTDTSVFDVYCDINFLSSGWKTITFEMNFNNLAESLWNAAKEVVEALLPGIGDKRKKREVAFNAYATANRVIRKIRDVSDSPNGTGDLENNPDSSSTLTTDYENRVSNFALKCKIITRHQEFLNDVVDLLFEISKEAKQSIDDLSEFTRNISTQSVKANIENLTRENTDVNASYAVHYNLSTDDLHKTIDKAVVDAASDPIVVEIEKKYRCFKGGK